MSKFLPLEFYNKSLKIDLAKLGESHPDIAGSYNNIAVVYNSQGDYSKALAYYEKSLLIYLAVFGESHPQVIDVIESVAEVYLNMGDTENAVQYMKRGAAAGSEKCSEYLRENGVE